MKKKIATALSYSDELIAPKVIAQGYDWLAEKIIEKGKASNVPIYEDPDLAKQLKQIQTGDLIPVEMYEVVAEVLVYISRIDGANGHE